MLCWCLITEVYVVFVSLQNDQEANPQIQNMKEIQDLKGEVHDLTTHVSEIRLLLLGVLSPCLCLCLCLSV
jgi:hypothetical protein